MKKTCLVSLSSIFLSACAVTAQPSAVAPDTGNPPPYIRETKPVPYPTVDTQSEIERLGIHVARMQQQIESLQQRIQQLERASSVPARTARPAARKDNRSNTSSVPARTNNTRDQDRYLQARQQYNQGRYTAAVNLLNDAEGGGNGSETDRLSMFLLMQSHYRLSNCESVINIGNRYANRFRSSPDAPDALYNVGLCQQRMQQRDIARDTLRKLIQTYPDSAAAKRAAVQLNQR
ncbi:hypothetical protein PL75_10245 [Neisseria arctica]|uniref:Tetratricopeptide repeat protein n=1 Tax=Neisseria arctica TaxID=1470200 RepID=A0A0J0YPL0_9NEIS|nr:tetratricopeptide repeat protein [Neisseria arctica]KLT72059.1 hypothetical protein PL75_10245 [Neisseria arctica]UOO87330.1 tetratricopeptide repeat protein [Neisseria arctica]